MLQVIPLTNTTDRPSRPAQTFRLSASPGWSRMHRNRSALGTDWFAVSIWPITPKPPTIPSARFQQGLATWDTQIGTIHHRRIVAIPYWSNFASRAGSFQQEDLVRANLTPAPSCTDSHWPHSDCPG